jgi:FkbM family methyltransferase
MARTEISTNFSRAMRMTRIFARLSTALNAANNFGNPIQIAKWRLLRKPSDSITVVDRASGVRCQCSLDSHHMFSEVWYAHVYDVTGVPIRPGDIVLDIGANQGFFTCYAAHKGAKVFAFEPVPELFERLVFNVKQNGFADRVTAVQCAIGESNSTAEMFVSGSLGGGQSSLVPEFVKNHNVPVKRNINVQCRPLSQILEEYSISSIRLCKIDVEGAELGILRSLKPHDIAKFQSIVMEYHFGAYPVTELFEMLEAWGTHHISLMDERQYNGNILRCVARGILQPSL